MAFTDMGMPPAQARPQERLWKSKPGLSSRKKHLRNSISKSIRLNKFTLQRACRPRKITQGNYALRSWANSPYLTSGQVRYAIVEFGGAGAAFCDFPGARAFKAFAGTCWHCGHLRRVHRTLEKTVIF
jgi:hypothetical protein